MLFLSPTFYSISSWIKDEIEYDFDYYAFYEKSKHVFKYLSATRNKKCKDFQNKSCKYVLIVNEASKIATKFELQQTDLEWTYFKIWEVLLCWTHPNFATCE